MDRAIIKPVYFFLMAGMLLATCVSSQISVSGEAQKKVARLNALLKLNASQIEKLERAETRFIQKIKEAQLSKNSEVALSGIRKKRMKKFKKILTHEQFIKFQAIENKRIKKLPIRLDKN